jgi:hypothetical protein
MKYPTFACHLALAAGLASAFAFAAEPLDNAYLGGLFKRSESDPKEQRPLPRVQNLEGLVNRNTFKVVDARTQEAFDMPVYQHFPVGPGVALQDLTQDLPDDGKTLVAPVDLTGSGVSDLVYARKDWGGWKVLSNGNRLDKPFQGFVTGLYEMGQDSPKADLIPASTHELDVDNDLLAAVGDFLGNGTEQLAYTRPGWSQVWIVGAGGVVQMNVDLKGIESNGPGSRMHWLLAFKSGKGGARHTRLAYYRLGADQLVTFAPQGMTFKRGAASLDDNWHNLNHNVKVLRFPREAPGKLEAKTQDVTEDVKNALDKLLL